MTGRLMLVVDDSPADRTSVRIAFERSGLPVSLSFAENAEKALAQLRASAEMPHMMLVDVHMPGLSGLGLLAELKRDKRLREIPIFMLSGTENREDVRSAYRGQACGFLHKPDNFEALSRMVEILGRLCVEALEYPQDTVKR